MIERVTRVPASKQQKILLVEDDPFLYKVLSQRLSDEGFDVTVASDGQSAIDQVGSLKPVLVLLDLILPKKSGFEVLTEIRKNASTAKLAVVVLSNLGQQEDIDQIEKLGVREYLVKADYSLSEMVKKIKSHAAAL
ncbi:response regulator [Patescibacteria group bacterium]|nr:MAG: response regulator [Patescibacteria group bacterium]